MTEDRIKIGVQLGAHKGELATLRERWLEAEELGVDALYTSDHLNAFQPKGGTDAGETRSNVFEAATIQAAMAATTTRPDIGCVVMANAYRAPAMTAFIAGTIDHISGGRYVLGMGTGYLKPDFDDLGFQFGTQRSRSEAFARDIPLILERLGELEPPPVRRIPLMIASTGERIGMPLVARYADIWHAYGPFEKLQAKAETLSRICAEQGRDMGEIEFSTYYMPWRLDGPQDTLDNYAALGCRQIIAVIEGPDWDLGPAREALQWRDAL